MEVVLLADKVGDPVEFAPAHGGTEAEQWGFGKAFASVVNGTTVRTSRRRGSIVVMP